MTSRKYSVYFNIYDRLSCTRNGGVYEILKPLIKITGTRAGRKGLPFFKKGKIMTSEEIINNCLERLMPIEPMPEDCNEEYIAEIFKQMHEAMSRPCDSN